MTSKGEAFQRSIDPTTPSKPSRECVRHALRLRRARLHAVVVAAGFASVTPIAIGAAFPPVFPLGSLSLGDGSRGFVLTGVDEGDRSGESVSAVGDVNGDGIDDFIIGAWGAEPQGIFAAGESYVVFGSTQGFSAVVPLESLYPDGGGDGSRGFVLTGSNSGQSGISVSEAGDVNGDGIDDLIIGASGADAPYAGSGESYVVFGSTQRFPAMLPLGTLYPGGGGDGSRGFVLTGIDADDKSGDSVSAAGDVNGDGIDDLLIAAHLADHDGHADAGESYVVFGSTQAFPPVLRLESLYPPDGDGSRGFVLTGVDAQDTLGRAVSAAGDVNGDGIDDLILGADGGDPGARTFAGESYVVFGSTQDFAAVFPLESLYPPGGGDGSRGFVLTGVDARDSSGFSVSAAGDVNGDGIDDIMIGARSADPGGDRNAGESYVVFGSTQRFPPVFRLARLSPAGGGDGSRGFVLAGIDVGDHSGSSVSAAGDVNGDGTDDLIIGAGIAAAGGHLEAGESYVVFGSTQGFPAIVPLQSLYPPGGGDGSRGFVLTGINTGDNSGCSVSAAGDVNGDGIDDIIIGAYGASPNGDSGAGESYVVFGRAAAP